MSAPPGVPACTPPAAGPADAEQAAHDYPPYRSPFWLPGGHSQTIVPALYGASPPVAFARERWTTPDGDFIDLDWLDRPAASTGQPARHEPDTPATPDAIPRPGHGPRNDGAPGESARFGGHIARDDGTPLLVLFHGLEGSSASHYARVLMAAARERGWRGVVPHFRTCSGALNLAPRLYHSGDSAEIDWILRRLRAAHAGPLLVAGVSLGGNALLRWLGERGGDAALIDAAAAISAPLDLRAGGMALSHGFNLVYTRNFLKTLKRKCLLKLDQYPRLFDRDAMLASRDLYGFDNVVTAPLHGYRDTDDYWHRASAITVLPDVTVPTLVLNARNDPFLPAAALPEHTAVGPAIQLELPAGGGHVGFMSGPFVGRGPHAFPGRLDWLGRRICAFFEPFTNHG